MAFPVAVVQPTLEPGDVTQNCETLTHMVSQAATQGAKLVLLPEACVSDIYRGAESLAQPIPGPATELISRVAGEATIALPLLEKAADAKVYSSCAVITAAGIKGIARKTHLYRDATGHNSFRDEEVVSAGDEFSIINVGEAKIGILLGFDAEFPESFRTLVLRGADLILVAMNTTEPDHAFLASMALRNRVPVLVSNRIGFRKVYPVVPEFSASSMSILQDKDGAFLVRSRGGSAIFDTDGKIVARPKSNVEVDLHAAAGAAFNQQPLAQFQEDEILTASFRLDELRIQRLTTPYLSERHPGLYER